MKRRWLAAYGLRWHVMSSNVSYAIIRALSIEGAVASQNDLAAHAQPRHGATDVLRLLAGAAMAALAATSLVDAPVWPLLVLRILVTELGYALALPAVALLAAGSDTPTGRVGSALGLLAAGLGLAPALRAAQIGRRLPEQLAAAFGEATPRAGPGALPRPAPLVIADLLRGVTSPLVRRSRRVYVVRDGQPLSLDLYQPAHAEGAAPGVLVVHGGSWEHGDSTEMASLNRYLAARGYIVAAINYRLSPAHPFPAARDDVLAALSYLKANAAAIGLDPARIVLLGRSAGGQLALLVAYTAADPAIRGAIGFYPATDLAYGYDHPCDPRLLDGCAIVRLYLGGAPDKIPATYAAASPITFAGPAAPPTLLVHGLRDELVEPAQSERLAARLAQADRPHLLLRLPWATHGYDANFSGPAGQLSTYAVERFLAAVTKT
jgi:acetyl esterase/lipase